MAYYFLAVKASDAIELNDYRSTFLEHRYPVQVADYLKHYQDGGNILNVMHVMDALI